MAATGTEYVTLNQAKILKDAGDKAITAAVASETDARTKADQQLQDAVDARLQVDDLVAGDNVTIDTESQPGKAVISSTGGGGGGDAYVLPVATADTLGGVKASSAIKVADDGTLSIADQGVTVANIKDGAVVTRSISNGAVKTTKIDDNSITVDKIVNGAVTSEKIHDGAVTAEKIADGVIPDVSGFVTKTDADATYQPKGNYLTSVPTASDEDFDAFLGI